MGSAKKGANVTRGEWDAPERARSVAELEGRESVRNVVEKAKAERNRAMQELEQAAEKNGTQRKRVEAVVETLANLRSGGESLAAVAHDARNMVTALGLYCDLLEEPGVLAAPYLHYGSELRLVATASRRLVEKLAALNDRALPGAIAGGAGKGEVEGRTESYGARIAEQAQSRLRADSWLERSTQSGFELAPQAQIRNLACELLASRNLLAALAGPSIAVTMEAEGCSLPVRLSGEDLTRILVNLVKNAAEAMPSGGRIHLGLRERFTASGSAEWVSLTVEDNGPGIPEDTLEKVFVSGYTTKTERTGEAGRWPATHRGLGLAISRSIVEQAGGRLHASNRSQQGARFEMELPVSDR
jgi:signal transduction histidine kinase